MHMSELSTRHPDILHHVFGFLDGEELAKAREVCKTWNKLAADEDLWKVWCVKNWESLQSDEELWRFIARDIALNSPNRWRKTYPLVRDLPQWASQLLKNGKYVCNLRGHPIPESRYLGSGVRGIFEIPDPYYFISHLPTLDIPGEVALHFEPEQECDRDGFNEYVQHLRTQSQIIPEVSEKQQRSFMILPRAGGASSLTAMENQSLVLFVEGAPTSDRSRTYGGSCLLL